MGRSAVLPISGAAGTACEGRTVAAAAWMVAEHQRPVIPAPRETKAETAKIVTQDVSLELKRDKPELAVLLSRSDHRRGAGENLSAALGCFERAKGTGDEVIAGIATASAIEERELLCGRIPPEEETGRLVDAALESLRARTRQRNDIPEGWRLNGDRRDVLISRTWLWPRTPALRATIRNEAQATTSSTNTAWPSSFAITRLSWPTGSSPRRSIRRR